MLVWIDNDYNVYLEYINKNKWKLTISKKVFILKNLTQVKDTIECYYNISYEYDYWKEVKQCIKNILKEKKV